MKLIASTLLAAGLALPAAATTLEITVTNNSGPQGLFFTPFLNVVHNGSYSPFTSGTTASSGIEGLAEVGFTDMQDPTRLGTTAAFEAEDASDATRRIGTLTEPAGFGSAPGQPPVFDPGNAASFTFELEEGQTTLSLLSMIIPSNDTFVSVSLDLFDNAGNLNLGDFAVNRDSVYDAGTEVNDQNGFGQAFNPADGSGPGFLGNDENGVVHLSSDAELATLFGQPVPPGFATITDGFLFGDGSFDFSNILTVSISEVAPVPLPASGWVLVAALGGLGAMKRRKSKAKV